jgi:hypothetical protein
LPICRFIFSAAGRKRLIHRSCSAASANRKHPAHTCLNIARSQKKGLDIPKENDLIVWEAVLDDKYTIKVTTTAPHRGELTVSGIENVLHREPVALSFDAPSGPDIPDVVARHEIVIRFVQNLGRP